MVAKDSLIYWKIRCLNRQTKTYFDRMLILDWSKLTDEQAAEVEAFTKGTSSNPRILKYRGFFREVTDAEFLELARDVNSARGVCLTGLEYFEDENGEHIGIVEQIQTVTGEPDPIIAGEPASVVRLGPSAILRRELWKAETANNIAHLLVIVRQLAKSNWLKSPLSLTMVPQTDGGGKVTRFECPDGEATRSVLLLIRQLISSDEAFVSACKAYCCHVADDRKRWWVQERLDSFNRSRNTPPFIFPIGTLTTREIIELTMYGARLIHRKPDDNRDAELAKAIEELGKQKVVMSFHACCRDVCSYAFDVYPVLRQELSHWTTAEGCTAPDLVDPTDLLRGDGVQELGHS